ncbi:hypothetical protein D9619_008389 [Psilocybe cf. subviscida]|uniref:Uncharacterized protein n=1 Tax=Psilocybe cf. subviscida TaxID=2480587 RepID=A0A8H5B9I4_9AGAR|nr:hypothetical protein D9619_008389 [Psilocybe cf. subviscida]
MDPLSAVLAIVSLTSAVKDMVELGQKIHESFAKVSKNLRKARRMAENIKEMIEEIKEFCEDHKDVLVNTKEFLLAVQSLLGKLRDFETSVLPLLPKTGQRKLGLFIRGWWNNNKIQESISDLESDVVQVMRRYMMKSTMRSEVKLEAIHQETSRGLNSVHEDITQGLEVLAVVWRDVSAIRTTIATTTSHRSYEFSGTTTDEFNRNVIIFAKSTPSTSAPMLHTPDMITEELMTAAYIKLQINSIAMTVERIVQLPASATDNSHSNSVSLLQLSPISEQASVVLKQASMSITHLRHHVVQQVTHIRNLLEAKRVHTISIQDSVNALNMLSSGLGILGMDRESTLVGKWAITLTRTLFDASRQPHLGAALAFYLLNQSMRYFMSGDNTQFLQSIQEPYAITQNLRNQDTGEEDFPVLYSRILLEYVQTVDRKRSIKISIEAVQVLEGILDVQAFTQSKSHGGIERVVHPISSFLDQLFFSSPPALAVRIYAHALHGLATYLSRDGHFRSALDLALLAISVHRKMVSIYGHEYRMDLALALASLLEGGIASHIHAEKLINLADESIQLLQDLSEQNPVFYTPQLVSVLCVKASALRALGWDPEAMETWDIAGLAGQIIQDSKVCAIALDNLSDQFRRLQKYDDTVRTVSLANTVYHKGAETQALRSFYLSQDLQHLHRYKKSAEAARSSVGLCRHLAMKDPGKWVVYLTKGLTNLAHCLAALGEYSDALIAWKESLSTMDGCLNTGPDMGSAAVIHQFLTVLDKYTLISYILEDKEKCLEVSSTVYQHVRRLSEIY